jgi:pantetheine-phosphate adenylyltransferase
MAGMNGKLAPGLDSVFLLASPGYAHIAASFVRQIAALGGDVTPFVPAAVAARLQAKFPPR